MTAIMYDSTEPLDIPSGAPRVAGYVNGDYRWPDAGWQRFATPRKARICVYIPGETTPNDGDVLDVEAKDAVTAAARKAAEKWVGDRIAAGVHPVIYTSLSTVDNFRGLYCSFWLADYTGISHMVSVPGVDVVATQYASPAYGSGGHYDLSLTVDNWPLAPKENYPMAENILHFESSKTGQGYWIVTENGVYAYGDIANVTGHPVPMLTKDNFHAFVVTPSGQGFWLVDVNANVYAYGDAPFYGHP